MLRNRSTLDLLFVKKILQYRKKKLQKFLEKRELLIRHRCEDKKKSYTVKSITYNNNDVRAYIYTSLVRYIKSCATIHLFGAFISHSPSSSCRRYTDTYIIKLSSKKRAFQHRKFSSRTFHNHDKNFFFHLFIRATRIHTSYNKEYEFLFNQRSSLLLCTNNNIIDSLCKYRRN